MSTSTRDVEPDPLLAGACRVTGRGQGVVAALAVTQTVGYGVLWYSFAVFLGPLAADLHVSRTAVTGASTSAVLAGALLAVPVGRWLDRHGGHALMTAGSVLGTLLLVAFAHVTTLVQLYLVWTGVGAVGAMVFYEAAFATVIGWTTPASRARALLAVTVVAGFASSIFLPLAGVLVDRLGWRAAALVLAGIHGAVTVPLHAFALRRPPHLDRHVVDGRAREARRSAVVRAALRDRRFWSLAVAFTAQAGALATMTLHLIGFLVAAGHPPAVAAWVAGTLGVLSVTGRLVVTGLNRRFPVARVVAAVFAVQACACLVLPFVAAGIVGAVAGVVAFGIGFGVSTIARPALLTERFGTAAYASLSGLLAVPMTLATAATPLLGAAVQHQAHSYTPVLLLVAAGNVLAAVAITVGGRTARPSGGRDPSGRPGPPTAGGRRAG